MKKALPYRELPHLDPVNDGRHQLRDLPLERESVPYTFLAPDEGLAAFCYTWVNKDHVAGSAFVVFGPGVGEPIAERVDGIKVSPDMNFDDWKVGSVHLKHDLQFQKSEMHLKGEGASIHAHFEAFHPPYAYGFHPDGCPDYAATNRIEQAGKVKGHFRIGDREIPFESFGARDHSWGTRDWHTPQHWKWVHVQAGPDLCVHFWEFQARSITELRGYVLRDGKMAEIDGVDVDFTRDEQWNQRDLHFKAHDTLGRTTEVKGRHYAHYPLIPDPKTVLNEGAMTCDIEGRAGMGWSEFMWPAEYLQHLRATAAGHR